jgi:PAS domain S-box-containing protein
VGAEIIFGYKAEEVIGKNISLLIPPDHADEAPDILKRMTQGEHIENFETVRMRKDGTIIPVSLNFSAIKDSSGKVIGASKIAHDITERKLAEESLRESEERLRLAYQAANIGAFEWNVQTGVNVWTPQLEAMYGLARGEFGKTQPAWEQLVHPEDRAAALGWVNQAFETGKPVEGEWRVVWRNGSVHWIAGRFQAFKDAAGKPLRLSGVNMDITERKRAEEALRESGERLKRSQEISHLGSWELDLVNDRLFWSDEVYRIFGLKPQEFGATYEAFLEAVHPDDRTAVDTAYSSSIRERRDHYEIMHRIVRKATGEVRIVHEKCEHLRDDSGRIIRSVGMVHDITERKRAEVALTASEAKYRSLFENMIDGLAYHRIVTDENGKPVDYIFLEANEAFEKLTGLKRTDIIGKSVREALPGIENDPADWIGTYGKVALTGQEVRFQHYAAQLGKWYSVSAYSPMKGYFVAIFEDITENKMGEAALRGSEERFRSMFERHQAVMLLVEPESGAIVDANDAASRFYGYPPERLRAMRIQDINQLKPEDVAAERKLAAEEKRNHFIFPHRLADGRVRWVEVYSTPFEAQGKPLLFSIIHDITERKQAEADVLKLSEDMAARNLELETVNKELESFVYSVSHDLRAPLRSVSGFSKILVEDYVDKLDAQASDYLARIYSGSEKMSQRIEALLHLSRISRQDLNRSEVALSRVASALVFDLRQADPGRNVEVVIAGGLTASADLNLIKVALSNLFENAWKFTSKTADARIEFGALDKEGQRVYYVKDNGAGFDPDYADRMFWPFHRLHSDQEFEGTGIGLAIVERAIRRHGGRIWAEGEPGKGAVFYFTL